VAPRRWAPIIAGLLLAFFGVVFALQGANVIKGSSVMSGNSTYIYVGGALAVIGLVLIATGTMSKPKVSGNV
jgi:tetrahydromethanopterin S-methyltransferase subunit C